MEDYLFSLFNAFGNYIRGSTHSEQWWIIIVAIAGIWILSFVLTKFIGTNAVVTRDFQILATIIKVCFLIELILVSWFCYSWAKTSVYQTDSEKLVHLSSLLLCIVIQIICFTSLSKGFAREKKLKNLNTPITRADDERKSKIGRQIYSNLKMLAFMPLLGLLLLLLPTGSKSIVSFLLDNSSSMENHLSNGRAILNDAISEFSQDTDIILSWFTENRPQSDFQAIVTEKDHTRLEGYHSFFSDKETAIAAINQIELTQGTPLIETIWSNFLFTQQQAEGKEYTRKIFVIVTDGGDSYVAGQMMNFLCSIPEFSEFYQDNISIINLANQNNEFFDKAGDCSYAIYEGMDLQSYAVSINQILEVVLRDRYYPAWLIIICSMGLLITLIVKPKKN